jgi:WD40 repeat protein/serine/threonine protein kinase
MTQASQNIDVSHSGSDGALDAWIELLAAFDSQLADESNDIKVARSDAEPSPGDVELFDEARTCLRLLHAARRRGEWPSAPHERTDVGAQASHATPSAARHASTDTHLDALNFTPVPAGETDSRPKKLDRFEIIDEVGQGGYGIIYRAIDPRLDRVVALKVPRPEIVASPELRLRVWREARAAAGLTHPNIAGIYEVGQLGPICWIAQEYCRGPSLDEWLARFRRAKSAIEAAQLVATLADGVEHAHARGVLHRDLKPDNVVLEPAATPAFQRWDTDDAEQSLATYVPKLTDFGLAKIAERSDVASSVGIAIGTPRYMAPEQIECNEEVCRATDVYGLGAILYEVWTGAPVFVGGTQAETFRQVLTSEPIAPSRMRKETPRDFEAIILRCLEKSPTKRYSTAAALAEDLRRFLAGLPTIARPLNISERAARWARREPAWATVAALAIIGPLILLAITLNHTRRLDRALNEADAKRELAERREYDLFRQSYPAEMRRAFEAYRVAEPTDARLVLERFRPAAHEEDLRGFEWGHLAHLCDPPCQELVGHQGAIYSIALSPDGKTIVTGSADGNVRLWDAATARPIAVLRGHENEVNGVAFSSDGRYVASASDDRTVRIWDVSTHKELRRLTDCRRAAINVEYTPDGRYLLATCADPAINVWDAAGTKLIKSLTGHQGHIAALAVSSDSKFALTGCDDRTVREWDLGTFVERNKIQGHAAGFAEGVAISPRLDRIALGGAEGTVQVWPMARGARPTWIRTKHRRQVETVAFSPDGSMLASAGHDGQVLLWDSRSGAMVGTLQAHTDRVWFLTFSHDGRRLLTASADKVARIWELSDAASRQITRLSADMRHPFAASGSGRFLAVQQPDASRITWWDVRRRTTAKTFELAGASRATALAISPSETLLAAAAQDNTVRLIDVSSGREVARLDGLPSPAVALDFSTNGTALVARSDTITNAANEQIVSAVIVWDISTGHRRFLQSVERLRRVALSPDGNQLATVAASQASIHLWDIESGRSQGELKGHRYDVHDLAFSPDGDTLASVAADATLRLWSVERRNAKFVLPHVPRQAMGLVFDPAGRTLAVAGPTDIELLHVATGQRMGTFRGTHGRRVSIQRIAFAPDGSAMFAWSVTPQGKGVFCLFPAKGPGSLTRHQVEIAARESEAAGE